jgi:1-deoxy-D-xylulose-5-phosphate reductoisomerase
VLALHPERYRVVGLAARSSAERLLEQVRRFQPEWAALESEEAARTLEQQLRAEHSRTRVLAGARAIEQLAADGAVNYVMAAITGAAGLRSTLAAAAAGKRLLLANKESAVMAGELLLATVRASGAQLVPIDSEHNAIFQCLPPQARTGEKPPGVRRILLTASGGPFRGFTREALAAVSPEQACAHPNWVMGRKISVDSATLMNKGLELIEACFLFGVPPEQVEIVVHPQSIVHSMVEYLDGSVLAQLGSPDMRTPIAHALGWPDRIHSGVQFLDLIRVARLDFQAPDRDRFRCLALAQGAAQAGGLHPVVLNAANEVAVQAFLERRLNFLDIAAVIEAVLTAMTGEGALGSLEDVLAADDKARRLAHERLGGYSATTGPAARGVHA